MFQKSPEKKSGQLTMIAVSLAALALIIAAVGTRAWLTNRRTLQTITKVSFSTLDLIGSSPAVLPVNLGEINIKAEGSKEIPFGILSEPNTKYVLQLGHTTNMALNYEIYRLSGENDATRTKIEGAYLNQDQTSSLANSTYHFDTYGDYGNVQKNAEPLYWKSNQGQCVCGAEGIDKYVLKVTWEAQPNIDDKETEMIYLTASLGGFILDETT